MRIILTEQDKCVLSLAGAVLALAINDYEKALRKHAGEPVKHNEITALEHFFLSGYGQALSFNHGELILERSKEKVANGIYHKVKVHKA